MYPFLFTHYIVLNPFKPSGLFYLNYLDRSISCIGGVWFFQDMWPRVQLLCAERNAPCQWDLAIKAKPPMSAANVRAMIRQICNVKPQDIVTTRSNELFVQLGIEDLDLILKERRLSWYGHVDRSNGTVRTAFDLQVDGKRGPGRPKMIWKQLTERDCRVEALGYRPSW